MLMAPLRVVLFLAAVCTLFVSQAGVSAAETPVHGQASSSGKQSFAYRWLDIAQEATAREVDLNSPRPTIISRTLAIWATAMYDAWAAYDDKAVGSRLGGTLRRPKSDRTVPNREKALSYASYQALLYVYPEDKAFLDAQMRKIGFDPSVVSTDRNKPEGVGNLAAQAVIAFRRHDGANQHGDEAGGNGEPYADYTYYTPVNPPNRIIDPDRWQPIAFTLTNGSKVTPGFLTPHWYRVKPFALENSAQFRPGPPPKTTSDNERLKEQTDQVLAYNRSLTHEQKAIVEFMRDGPRSTGQSGHWLRFAQDVSRRDRYDLDRDVKLFFVVANVAMDAFISCWETKRYYDSSRPWTLVRHYYAGQRVTGWAGPNGGVKEMPAEEWCPYSPQSFITPPFPGYTSGHATVSGACSKVLELFTGSDALGFVERRRHCELTETAAGDLVALDLPTFSATAEMAAVSRAMGGYHIPIDNDVGLKVGREIAAWSWPKYQAYFSGSAASADQITQK